MPAQSRWIRSAAARPAKSAHKNKQQTLSPWGLLYFQSCNRTNVRFWRFFINKYKYSRTIVIGHKDDGTPIRKYIQDNNKARFEAKVRAVQMLVARGGTPGKVTVEQWAWQWYHTYKEPHVGESQRNNYEEHLRLRICPAIGFLALDSVKPFQLQEMMNNARTSKGKPLGASTAAKLHYITHAIFDQAEINGLIASSPFRRIETVGEDEKSRRALTRAEEQIVREVAKRHYAGPWVLLMLDCGLRRGETVPIGARDVKDGLLCISQAVEYKTKSNQPTLKSTKTAAGARYVPIPDELQKQLDMKSRYFFHVENGRMLSMTKMRRMWHSFYRACDIAAGAELYRNAVVKHAFDPAITPHYLRHTYCSNLRRQGVDLKTAQYLMGHADISTTANIYSHVTEEDVRGLKV